MLKVEHMFRELHMYNVIRVTCVEAVSIWPLRT